MNLSGSTTEGASADASRVRALSEVPDARRRCRTPLRRTPLYALHVRSAPRWCRSPAMRCRCSTRPASSPSICTPAPQAGLFDVSHMGQLRADRRRPGGGARNPGAGRHRGARPDADALHAAAQRSGRHPRRSDGDAAWRRRCSSSSTPRPRTRDLAHLRDRLGGVAWRSSRSTTARCWRCRGRRRPRCWRGSPAASRDCRL